MVRGAPHDGHDPTVYPEEERVGEEMLQRWIAELLRPLLETYLNGPGGRGPCFVGADQFIYYRQHDPLRRFAPDVYVIPGLAPDTRVRSWKTWRDGSPPSFALEVASSDWRKDYVDAPERCDEAGITELVVFDPSYLERPGGEGARFQVWRRALDGRFGRVERHDDDRVWCATLGLWLRLAGFGDRARLRIATGARGEALIPTEVEFERAQREAERAQKEAERAQKEAERAQKEAERAQKEAERAQKEAERAQKEAALERVRALEARLRELEDEP